MQSVSGDRDAPVPQSLRERTEAVAHEQRFFVRFGDMHGDGEVVAPREGGHRTVQRRAHRVGRVWRNPQRRQRRDERLELR